MYFYLVAFGLMAHVLFWGAGLAIWTMPQRWRKFWPVLAVPAGFTLQALMVWVGSLAGLKGTNSYAWWSEAVPLAVLLGALARHVRVRVPTVLHEHRHRAQANAMALKAAVVGNVDRPHVPVLAADDVEG